MIAQDIPLVEYAMGKVAVNISSKWDHNKNRQDYPNTRWREISLGPPRIWTWAQEGPTFFCATL